VDILKVRPTERNADTRKQFNKEGFAINEQYANQSNRLFEFAQSDNRGGVQDITNRTSGGV
jgi:hypothetical protein